MMQPGLYLAGIAQARATYKALYAEAVALLPPPSVGEGTFRLESVKSLKTLASELDIAPSTVRGDLILLTNYGWLRQTGERVRFLGQRQGGSLFLLADDRAETFTGEKLLVSRALLKVEPLSAPPEGVIRGPQRASSPPTSSEAFPLPPMG
jgi:hypothetical protein